MKLFDFRKLESSFVTSKNSSNFKSLLVLDFRPSVDKKESQNEIQKIYQNK